MALRRTDRLTREKWAEAALMLMAREGIGAVSIERLATTLQVTKGSAYHHFRSRDELVERALASWEEQSTSTVIEQLAPISDPRERLRAILTTSVGRHPSLGVEYLIVSASDAIAAPFIKRVTLARVAFLEQIYRDFGMSEDLAAIWGRTAYAAYLGAQLLHQTDPDDQVMARLDSDYVDQLMVQLTPAT